VKLMRQKVESILHNHKRLPEGTGWGDSEKIALCEDWLAFESENAQLRAEIRNYAKHLRRCHHKAKYREKGASR
jgi:hypothetical protein